MEFVFVAKSCYFKFESALEQMEAKKRLGERERLPERYPTGTAFQWFHSTENQSMLLQNLQALGDLGYETRRESGWRERREVMQEKPRSVSLFILSGEERFMDGLQSRMRLRSSDISERSGRRVLRGALTHLKETSPSDIENVIRRFTGGEDVSRLKCLVVPIRSPKDLERRELTSAEMLLQEMAQGEIRRLEGCGPLDSI